MTLRKSAAFINTQLFFMKKPWKEPIYRLRFVRHTSVKRNRYKPEAKGFSIKNHKVLLYRISWVYKRYKMLLPHRKQRSEDPKPENDFQEFLYTYKKRLVSERFRLKFLPQVRKKCRDRILLFWEVWEERIQT